MKYETILFDIDDTLFDFGKSEESAFQKAFLEFGFPTGVEDYRPRYKEISKVLWGELEQGLLTLSQLGRERFNRLFSEYQLKIDGEQFNQIYLNYLGEESHLISGALDVCTNLTGCRLAVITNGFGEVQKSRIARSPLCSAFDQIIVSEEAGYQKPHQGIFDYAFSKLNITEKEKVLIVGDSLTSDIQGGINYGIDTCWFNPGYKENTLGIEPTFEIRELTDIIKIVERKQAITF